jgi:hypothetical protein
MDSSDARKSQFFTPEAFGPDYQVTQASKFTMVDENSEKIVGNNQGMSGISEDYIFMRCSEVGRRKDSTVDMCRFMFAEDFCKSSNFVSTLSNFVSILFNFVSIRFNISSDSTFAILINYNNDKSAFVNHIWLAAR